MSESIVNAIEAVREQLIASTGHQFGSKAAAAEILAKTHGDYLLAISYASLFFPLLSLSNGVPMARFATSDCEQPIDCVHIDLLHHNAAAGRSCEFYAALGQSLAVAWTNALQRKNLPGRFLYDTSTGFDVVYEP